jgi:predicted ATPase
VGVDGGNVPELLHDNPDLLRNVNKWLLRLGLDGPIEIRTYPTVDAIFEMRLVGNRTPRDGVNVADVGFGVSQVLPLVVQSVSQENRLLLVEQPEIHLHPALQAELADLVISGIGPKRGNQYIIETHSEHLLLRLMRRIRETSAGKSERRELRVTADQVQVLYVERRRGHSIVRQMDLNANGELTKAWPGGFFEEGLREVL